MIFQSIIELSFDCDIIFFIDGGLNKTNYDSRAADYLK